MNMCSIGVVFAKSDIGTGTIGNTIYYEHYIKLFYLQLKKIKLAQRYLMFCL